MTFQRYRKKPIEVEAVQITAATFDDPHPNPAHIPGVVYDHVTRCAFIKTLEGEMRADLGDWIIKGVKGELYPCKPDIFEATYDEVGAPHFPNFTTGHCEHNNAPGGCQLPNVHCGWPECDRRPRMGLAVGLVF